MVKDNLRDLFKRQLNELNKQDKSIQSEKIFSRLHSYLSQQTGLWTLFSPLNDEPNILPLLQSCSHLQWVFPRVESKQSMRFFKVINTDELITSSWGLDEPPADPERAVDAEQITGCIIPGLAFDKTGTRLGRGGGFYDRFLQNFKGLKLGVTFEPGLTKEALPRKSHDQHMNIVVSPEHWIEVDTSEVTDGF